MPGQLARIAVGILAAACVCVAPSRAEPLDVFVSIPPQKHIVERIGAGRVKTAVLVSPGKDAHSFEPSPLQASRLAKADLFFTIGLSLEQTVVPKLKGHSQPVEIVDMAEGIERRPGVCSECGHDHSHGHAHSHGAEHPEAMDPHVWLSTDGLKVLAGNTAKALSRVDPEGKAEYVRRAAELEKDLDALRARAGELLAPYRGRVFYVFHPAYGYFAADFGLRQESVETGGRQIAPKRLRELVAQARRDKVRVLFTQPQFDRRQADAVARAIGAKVVSIDPLAENPLETIETMANSLAESFRVP